LNTEGDQITTPHVELYRLGKSLKVAEGDTLAGIRDRMVYLCRKLLAQMPEQEYTEEAKQVVKPPSPASHIEVIDEADRSEPAQRGPATA
jgi:hypothetical protein